MNGSTSGNTNGSTSGNTNENTDELDQQIETLNRRIFNSMVDCNNPPSLKTVYIQLVQNILASKEKIKEVLAPGPRGVVKQVGGVYDHDIDFTNARETVLMASTSMFIFTDGGFKVPIGVIEVGKRSEALQLFSCLVCAAAEFSRIGKILNSDVSTGAYLLYEADIMGVLGLKIKSETSSDVPQFPTDEFFRAIAHNMTKQFREKFFNEQELEAMKILKPYTLLGKMNEKVHAMDFSMFYSQMTSEKLANFVWYLIHQLKAEYSSNDAYMDVIRMVEIELLVFQHPVESPSDPSASNRILSVEHNLICMLKLQQVVMSDHHENKEKLMRIEEIIENKDTMIEQQAEQTRLLRLENIKAHAQLDEAKEGYQLLIKHQDEKNGLFKIRDTEYKAKEKESDEKARTMSRKISEQESEIARLKKRINELEVGEKAKNEKTQNQLKEKSKKVTEQESTIERLRKQINELKTGEKIREIKASEQIDSMSMDALEQICKIEVLESRIEKLMAERGENELTELKLKHAEQRVVERDQQLLSLRKQINSNVILQAETEISAKKAELQVVIAAEKALELNKQHEKHVSTLLERIETVEMQLNYASQNYNSQIENLMNENKKLSELDELASIQRNEAKLETDKLRAENRKLEEMLEHLSKDLEKEKNKSQSEVQSLHSVQSQFEKLDLNPNTFPLVDPVLQAFSNCTMVEADLQRVWDDVLFMETRVPSGANAVYSELAHLKKMLHRSLAIVNENFRILKTKGDLNTLHDYVIMPPYSTTLQSLLRHFKEIERLAAGSGQQLPNQTGRQSEESRFSTSSSSPSSSNQGPQWQLSNTQLQSNMPQWTSGTQWSHTEGWQSNPTDWMSSAARWLSNTQSTSNQANNPVQSMFTNSLSISPAQRPVTISQAYEPIQATSTSSFAFNPAQRSSTSSQAHLPVQATTTSSLAYSPVQRPPTSSQVYNQDPFMTNPAYSSMQQASASSQAYSASNILTEQEPKGLSFPYAPPGLFDASSYDMFASADDSLVGFTLEGDQNDN